MKKKYTTEEIAIARLTVKYMIKVKINGELSYENLQGRATFDLYPTEIGKLKYSLN